MNFAEKLSRTASKTYLGAPLGLFNKDLSDNEELCIRSRNITAYTSNTWEIFIIDYSAECDDNFDCFLYDENKSIAITDCSIVGDSSTVNCYKIAYKTNALAAAGGLITIFKVIPLITLFMLLKIYYYCALLIEKLFRRSISEKRFFEIINHRMSNNVSLIMFWHHL